MVTQILKQMWGFIEAFFQNQQVRELLKKVLWLLLTKIAEIAFKSNHSQPKES